MPVRIKRAYEPPSPEDGSRVLVDRYWPRGLSRESASLTDWQREIAPSPELIRWFGHRVERWEEFRQRYTQELRDGPQKSLRDLSDIAAGGQLTLVYSARDPEHNNAIVLRDVLQSMRRSG